MTAPSIRVDALRKTYQVPEREGRVRAAARSVFRRSMKSVPVETLVGRLEETTLGATGALAVAFLVGSRWFWKFGLRHYTGASA